MSTRERWLIWGMIGAVVFGGYTLIAHAVRAQTTARRAAAAASDVGEFAATTRRSVARLRLTPEEQFVLDRTIADWPDSPFFDRPDAARPLAEKPQDVRYTGYLHVGTTRLAIINGREYRVTETVEATDFVVESIDADHVVLGAKGGGRRVSVALKETEPTREKP